MKHPTTFCEFILISPMIMFALVMIYKLSMESYKIWKKGDYL